MKNGVRIALVSVAVAAFFLLGGALAAEVSADGRSALLRQVGDGERYRYGGLYVYDAAGKELSARLSSGKGEGNREQIERKPL